ncbi:hypothetical protein [Actinacidiphila alni]|uniref:hypothetical protein n=1 Tax=Actinacidiphila alni TaxID=380248 RepID=UPI0011600F6A|nr:hypothetical protein [Actinacidiphila alni]
MAAVLFALLGVVAAYAASRFFPARIPADGLLLGTGAAGGLIGGLVMRTILDGSYPAATLPAAFATAAALVSLLARPPKRGRHAKTRPAA